MTLEIGEDDLVVVVSQAGRPHAPPQTRVYVGGEQVGLISRFELVADVSDAVPTTTVDFTRGLDPESLERSNVQGLASRIRHYADRFTNIYHAKVTTPWGVRQRCAPNETKPAPFVYATPRYDRDVIP